MPNQDITQDQIQELLHYNPETGILTWKVNRKSYKGKAKAGSRAGRVTKRGYRQLGVLGYSMREHVAIFIYMTGERPNCHIDHINRVRDDNRWVNLRLALRNQSDNNQNMQISRRNTSGYQGVCFDKHYTRSKPWLAQISHNNRRIRIGYFETAEKAHFAYLSKKRELHSFYSDS